jgi:predicted dehydrogenase
MTDPLRVLVVGLGNMGLSHARAYHALDGWRIAGLCSRSIATQDLPAACDGIPRFEDFETALAELRPEAVCIATWPDTHEAYAIRAMQAGAHVFLEKPLAETLAGAERVARAARTTGRKLVVGYILQHHPAWTRFVELARTLGKPLVMRMNLNQQSSGPNWLTHKALMQSLSPIVDCGVHYVDVMRQMTGARPVAVHAIGARLTDEVNRPNYGCLQVIWDDGSVGWYEAGWGPMMSETAFFVKDVIGPKGAASIVASESGGVGARSDDVDAHTRTNALRLHHAALAPDGRFARPDEVFSTADEPDHDALCRREQAFFLRAIREDLDLADHVASAVDSLAVVLAADRSIAEGIRVEL